MTEWVARYEFDRLAARVDAIDSTGTRGVAVLAVHKGKALVAILQDKACLTVLTWPQFEPRMPEFGRTHLPRKRGRMLRRLVEPEEE